VGRTEIEYLNEEDKMDLETLAKLAPWEWPEETGQVLLNALRDDGLAQSDRMIAVELAGNYVVVNDELVAELVSIVVRAGESEDLRARAAIALGPALEAADEDGFDDLHGAPISERCYLETQVALRELFRDVEVPKEVRRRILEASVRAPQDWYREAIRDAYASADKDWKLTAVFAMGFVRGFDDEILEALESGDDEIEYQAVCAAGDWGLDAAWSHVSGIVASGCADKELLLAAIEAVASIRPRESGEILVDLIDHNDEDVVECAREAMAMADGLAGLDVDDEADDNFPF
jgi:hypothetical protein